jgi:hypothetical protein
MGSFCNRDEVYLLRRANWFFDYNRDRNPSLQDKIWIQELRL